MPSDVNNNTGKSKSLPKRLFVDFLSATVSAGLVAPIISIIDTAIFSNASGKEKLVSSIISSSKRLVFSPIQFVRNPAHLWIFFVYSGTYIIANTTQTLCDHTHTPWEFPKFITSSFANVSLSLAKDGYYTRTFGKGIIKPVPLQSYLLYGTRDSLTILASFILPPHISKLLQKEGIGQVRADILSQLVTPCAMQIFSTPLHLLGMDIYNAPQNNFKQRVEFIQREYVKTAIARISRIFPAFGVGGVVNKYVRHMGNAYDLVVE